MNKKYEYLERYRRNNYKGPIKIGKHNIFYSVSLEEIKKSEEKLRLNFPSQLKDFYLEIGFGHLTTPYNVPEEYDSHNYNLILPPNSVACFYNGQLCDDHEQYYMSEISYELLEPGDLPFFEIGDSSAFLVMKLHSDNPNAVWSDCGVKIEDSFEKFIWRLYYENPTFYGRIIEAHYAK